MLMVFRQKLIEFINAFCQMGLMTIRRNGIEKDDVIGAITHKSIATNVKTVILSTDKAYRQLLQSPLYSGIISRKKIWTASRCTQSVECP
ncbi:hypothetical protein [Endozoicomonas sp. SESOKO1]|uniref:hypothetical protein n=1 Tax=Endozoicomonas sp. SESOKO1 TaxID=2828742 RepID=UPI002148A515|nr:hypothetical protein [Endozoicomonas sp. SESOKO1]